MCAAATSLMIDAGMIDAGDRVVALPRLGGPRTPLRLYRSRRGEPGRAGLEAFVRRVFRATYGAEIGTFCPELLGLSRPDHTLCAVAGVRPAATGPLYSEYYLDAAAEDCLSRLQGAPVSRDGVVEIGNLAPAGVGQARWLIATLTAYLHAAGFEWVVFTAVPMVFNAFARMGLPLRVLARAEAARLPAEIGDRWGRYYEARPVVCCGEVGAGYRLLSARLTPDRHDLWDLWHAAIRLGGDHRPRPADRYIAQG